MPTCATPGGATTWPPCAPRRRCSRSAGVSMSFQTSTSTAFSVGVRASSPMAPDLAVSVVVPVLNGAETIGDLLSAVTHQLGAPRDSAVIVVDNGSTDSTPDVVARFPVTYLQESTPGPSAARNRGLSHARGDVVVFVDADTVPTR